LLPISFKLTLVQFSPRFNQSLLTLRQRSGDKSDRTNGKNCGMVLLIRVKMGLVMTC
jgi:hypothetical protein